jgi:hypothetical protein
MQDVLYVPTLLVPSLNSDTDFMTMINVSKEEAIELLTDFDARVAAKRKIGDSPTAPIDGVLDVLEGGNLDLAALVEDESLSVLIETLSTSNIQRARGRRAVFLDVENDVIGVGTTVIYNRNWAMTGVADDSVISQVLAAAGD